jgi:hypothetical protein
MEHVKSNMSVLEERKSRTHNTSILSADDSIEINVEVVNDSDRIQTLGRGNR